MEDHIVGLVKMDNPVVWRPTGWRGFRSIGKMGGERPTWMVPSGSKPCHFVPTVESGASWRFFGLLKEITGA
jgi:hypothetical protein